MKEAHYVNTNGIVLNRHVRTVTVQCTVNNQTDIVAINVFLVMINIYKAFILELVQHF
jgi:hypothetical protein